MKSLRFLRLPVLSAIATVILSTTAQADTVYVTSLSSNCTSTTICGSNANADQNSQAQPVYAEGIAASFTSAVAAAPGKPSTPGARFYSNSFSNSTPDLGVTISPTLGVPGAVYRLYHVFSSAAGNVSTNILMGITNVDGCTISTTNTDKLRTTFGVAVGGQNPWQFICFVTNNPGVSNPVIRFYRVEGIVNSGAQQRVLVDTFRFVLYNPCQDVFDVGVTGPLATNSSTVIVTGVSNAATKITVYQNSGAGMVEIGNKTTGVVAGNNSVTVSGLVKGAQVAATQTVSAQEGCTPASGLLVGGGANPRTRMALSIRETSSTGPVGAPGNTASGNIHFLGALTLSAGSPVEGLVIYRSNDWQTVTFSAGRVFVGNASNAVGAVSADPGVYAANDSVSIQVYSYRFVPETSTTIYSRVNAQSLNVTSNDVFGVNWSWTAAPDAEGYRLLRNLNNAGYVEFLDVNGTNFYSDTTPAWNGGPVVTPTSSQLGSSVKWNTGSGPAVGTQNALGTQWGIIESINFVIDDLSDTGPQDVYVDNFKNGTTTWETFETAPANTTDYGYRVPTFSGTTSGNIMGSPNIGQVVNSVSDTGTKSFRISFQWNGTNATKWLRLTTSGVNNPQVNLDEPITFRLLMQPVNAALPAAPAAPSLTANLIGGKTVFNWTGGHRLQTSVDVTGTYTNAPQALSPNTWTNINLGGFLSPYTNSFTESNRFFRLRD